MFWLEISVLIIFIISIATFILQIIALIDILKSNLPGNDKIVWVLVVLFLPLIGSILYFIIGKKKKIQQE